MKVLLVSYLAALATLAMLDALWLGLIARRFYKARLGSMLLDQPKWVVALFFYLIHAAGVVVFAAPLADSWLMALVYGAAFGFCVYAAYDITNLATVAAGRRPLARLIWHGVQARPQSHPPLHSRRSVQPPSRHAAAYSGCRRTNATTKLHAGTIFRPRRRVSSSAARTS